MVSSWHSVMEIIRKHLFRSRVAVESRLGWAGYLLSGFLSFLSHSFAFPEPKRFGYCDAHKNFRIRPDWSSGRWQKEATSPSRLSTNFAIQHIVSRVQVWRFKDCLICARAFRHEMSWAWTLQGDRRGDLWHSRGRFAWWETGSDPLRRNFWEFQYNLLHDAAWQELQVAKLRYSTVILWDVPLVSSIVSIYTDILVYNMRLKYIRIIYWDYLG